MSDPVPSSQLRQSFAASLSDMYRAEVPAYGTLVDLVSRINADRKLSSDPLQEEPRIDHERHGAIRLAHPGELSIIRRALRLLGMFPVGYYDLSPAGLPVHSTAFRPVNGAELEKNAFRLFTSLIRLDQIASEGLRKEAQHLVARRSIITPDALRLIESAERSGGLNAEEGPRFVTTLMDTFRWRGEALASFPVYQAMAEEHPLVADVVCFPNPHVNHLTPRVVDIDLAQAEMVAAGLPAKEKIEGPPRRSCPVLLRQTAFQALDENVGFPDGAGETHNGLHTARFGEIEARGAALTPEGMHAYDKCLATGDFDLLPDDWDGLRHAGLAWFRYERAAASEGMVFSNLEHAIREGRVVATPITYEDFLPVSAAGIFRSNLKKGGQMSASSLGSRADFESALGRPLLNYQSLYKAESGASLRDAVSELEFTDP